MSNTVNPGDSLTFRLGREQLVIQQRYQTASIANDFLIAIWFLVGSIFFLFPALQQPAAWLFVIGSFQFIVRPTIRLARHIHLRHLPESSWDS